jgi:NhaP-type Na+/H+ or K+/H+ antiporter
VLAGAALGIAVGLIVAWAVRRLSAALSRSGTNPPAVGTSFAPNRRSQG